jgi:hypothetical protein
LLVSTLFSEEVEKIRKKKVEKGREITEGDKKEEALRTHKREEEEEEE